MKKAKTILLALSLPLLLVSCNNSQGNGTTSSEASSVSSVDPDEGLTDLDPCYASSVKSYLKTLIKVHNYTLKEEVSSSVSSSVNQATSYYGKDFFISKSLSFRKYQGARKIINSLFSLQKRTPSALFFGISRSYCSTL